MNQQLIPISQEQRDLEVDKLKDLLPRVPPSSFFGDNNHEAINAQIRVLKEGMTEDDIFNTWLGEDDVPVGEPSDQHTQDAAMHAYHWAQGNDLESPSESYEAITRPKESV